MIRVFNMKVAVLGSNSFSGSHMVDYLLEHTGAEVIGLSRSPEYDQVFLPYLYKKDRSDRFRFFQFDLNKDQEKILSLLDEEKPDVVINYAAQGEVRTSWNDPAQWFQTNCMSLVRLADELSKRDYVKRFIQASTPEVYGSCSGNVEESFRYRPSTPYAASKAAGDLFLTALSSSKGFPVVLTRAANVYGIHQQLYRIIPRTAIYLKLGKKIQLHGGGMAERSFIHIRDNCAAVLKMIRSKSPSEIYHLSPNGSLMKIRDVVRFVCDKMGHDFEKSTEVVGKPTGQDSVYELDSSRARAELDWDCSVKFADGVQETVEWIDENWEFIKKQSHEYVHKE